MTRLASKRTSAFRLEHGTARGMSEGCGLSDAVLHDADCASLGAARLGQPRRSADLPHGVRLLESGDVPSTWGPWSA